MSTNVVNELLEKAKLAPNEPGVYTFIDNKGLILYVGKAISIKNRLMSYFNSSPKHPKTLKMIQLARDLKYFVTTTESEALLLESSLIKNEKPKFNVKLKDAKGYPYIKLTIEKYPRIIITRDISDKNATYYGPFVSATDLKTVIRDLQNLFPLRKCTNSKFNEHKLCIYYQMKKCLGPCENFVTEDEYLEIVKDVKQFFRGNTHLLEQKYKTLIEKYAQNLEFEKAAIIRDRLLALKDMFHKQSITTYGDENIDVIYFKTSENLKSVTMVFIRNGQITGIDTKFFNMKDEIFSDSQWIINFYSNTRQFPNEIIIQGYDDEFEIEQTMRAISKISGNKISLKQKIPPGLEHIVIKNNTLASEIRVKKLQNSELTKQKLKDIMGTDGIVKIECIDISHYSGSNTVGVSICYDIEAQKFEKSRYRKYKIKTVSNNDTASIYEVVKRKIIRIRGGKEQKSDLYIIDGGLGQLNAAKKASEEENFPLNFVSIAKGRSKSLETKLKDEISPEYVFVPGRKNPLNFRKNDQLLLLFQKIRDEAHRFVITYARNLSLRNISNSNLLKIKHLGKSRLKSILTNYPDIKEIFKDTPEDASKKTGIPIKTLKAILDEIKNHIL
mgnify:CR=1 FL=1